MDELIGAILVLACRASVGRAAVALNWLKPDRFVRPRRRCRRRRQVSAFAAATQSLVLTKPHNPLWQHQIQRWRPSKPQRQQRGLVRRQAALQPLARDPSTFEGSSHGGRGIRAGQASAVPPPPSVPAVAAKPCSCSASLFAPRTTHQPQRFPLQVQMAPMHRMLHPAQRSSSEQSQQRSSSRWSSDRRPAVPRRLKRKRSATCLCPYWSLPRLWATA